ncbi:MAG: TIGR04255 family protein, partial [Nitrospira sp.]|nr:TIGR04255 family protein [Nitrospira sp.]
MSNFTRFPRAPITEALLDIRVKLPPQIDLIRLATFHDTVKDRYPSKQERVSWQGGFQITPGTGPEMLPSSGGPDGYLFPSADGRQIVQARLDGFTFNRLKPYDKWETFRDEAKELWQQYVRIASPEVVTRLALRYINRIEIPLPMKDFKE